MKKRSKKQMLNVLVMLGLTLTLLAGCQNTAEEAKEEPSAQQETSAEEATQNEETKDKSDKEEEPKKEETADGKLRTITDMAGRKVEVPASIEKVFPTDPVAGIYLYTLNPDRMLGWNYDLNDLEKQIILPEYHDLPSFGMGESVNYEAVIAAGPQVALYVTPGDEAGKAEADKLTDSLGVPVVCVSDDLEQTAEVYRFLGDLTGDEEQAEKLAAYVDETFSDIEQANISEEDKVTVYYGNGADSLETAPRGSTHGQILEYVRAMNVADLEVEGGSRVQVSLEQLLAWDPQYIIVNGEPKENLAGDAAAQEVMNNPEFASLQAVQSGNVYGTPNTPFSWVDRPQSANRIIGLRWLSKVFYPDLYDYDLNTEVKEFYQLFYHTELTDQQVEQVMTSNFS